MEDKKNFIRDIIREIEEFEGAPICGKRYTQLVKNLEDLFDNRKWCIIVNTKSEFVKEYDPRVFAILKYLDDHEDALAVYTGEKIYDINSAYYARLVAEKLLKKKSKEYISNLANAIWDKRELIIDKESIKIKEAEDSNVDRAYQTYVDVYKEKVDSDADRFTKGTAAIKPLVDGDIEDSRLCESYIETIAYLLKDELSDRSKYKDVLDKYPILKEYENLIEDYLALPERIFWLNMNDQGLNELGYPMTEEQLLSEFPNKVFFDAKSFLSGNTFEESEGSFCGNNTFTVKEVKTRGELKSLMTWDMFDPQESHASGALNEEYPDFVHPDLRCSRYIYEFTGFTAEALPRSSDYNETVDRYCDMFRLDKESLSYMPTDHERAMKEISEPLYDRENLTEEYYEEILKKYGLTEYILLLDFYRREKAYIA